MKKRILINNLGRKYMFILLLFSFAIICGCSQQANNSKGIGSKEYGQTQRPNVLFICVDDLRPELGCYGCEYIHSPNLDKLALEGFVFTNHYAQVPTCGASRLSMLTGMLPRNINQISDSAIETTLSGLPENEIPETFIHLLRKNGYYTVGIGKISHHPDGYLYGYNEPTSYRRELPYSWDEVLLNAGKWGTGWNAFFGYADGTNRQGRDYKVKPYEKGDVDDDGYPDGLTANLAIQKLNELTKKSQPFLLGVGFFKPHLPFNSPGKYWELYNESGLPLTPSPNLPTNVNKASLHESPELNRYEDGDEKASLEMPVSDAYARKLHHAYFAAISYVDAQIGKVLYELEKLGLAENTIVVVWGDHGWHLGDQRLWGKEVIFDRALNSTLIIKTLSKGKKGLYINRIVSSIDIYPTLMELCGVKIPFKTDGKSLVPLMENASIIEWENISFGYFRKGISLRTERYRLSKYFREEEPVIELYDHDTDPYENRNIAAENKKIVEQLMPIWEKGNTGLYDKVNEQTK